MKKVIILFFGFFLCYSSSYSQRIAVVDTEKILNMLPTFTEATKNMNTIRYRWKRELDQIYGKIEHAKDELEIERLFLTDDIIKKRETEIDLRLKAFYAKQEKYFGEKGNFFQIQNEYFKPIYAEIYDAVEAVSKKENISLVLEKKADINILFADKTVDKTNQVLVHMGFDNVSGTFKSKEFIKNIKKGFKNQVETIKKEVSDTYKSSKDNLIESLDSSVEKLSKGKKEKDNEKKSTKNP